MTFRDIFLPHQRLLLNLSVAAPSLMEESSVEANAAELLKQVMAVIVCECMSHEIASFCLQHFVPIAKVVHFFRASASALHLCTQPARPMIQVRSGEVLLQQRVLWFHWSHDSFMSTQP